MAETVMWVANTVERVTTAAPAIIMAVDTIPTTVTTRAGRTLVGVTARPRDITRTHTEAAIPTVVTIITTHTTGQRTVIADQRLQPCNGALANSVTIMA